MERQSAESTELIRRIENIVRLGVIADVDLPSYRVRVRVDAQDDDDASLLTNWIPWQAMRAGTVRVWSAPSLGEQCTILSPGGDMAQGVALPGIYSDDAPPADSSEHSLVVDAPANGGITLRCGDSRLVIDSNSITLHASRIDLNP